RDASRRQAHPPRDRARRGRRAASPRRVAVLSRGGRQDPGWALRLGLTDSLDLENQLPRFFALCEKAMAGGLAEMLEVLDRAGIGGDDAEHAARGHVAHRLARLQHGKRAFEPARVENDRRRAHDIKRKRSLIPSSLRKQGPRGKRRAPQPWIPAFAGMTEERNADSIWSDRAYPNRLFLAKPLGATRPLEARAPIQARRSVSVRVPSPRFQESPSARLNTLASESAPS